MVEQVTHGKALPSEVLEQIVAKTDGVPLFVEELTKTVIELDLLQDAGERYVLGGPLPPLAIPASLYDSLMARLDRLAPVKEVAQIGAVIGREFGHELLAAVASIGRRQAAGRPRRSWSMPSWSSATAHRHTRPIRSSTPWFRTPLTRACCAADASSCMPASPTVMEERFAETSSRPSPSCWLITALRRV